MNILAIDAGNSRVKGRYFAGPREPGFEFAFPRHQLTEAVAEEPGGLSGAVRAVDAVAVCAGRDEDRPLMVRLAEILGGSGAPVFLLSAEEPLPFPLRYEPGRPGGDRLANAIALREHFPGRAAMAVDIGTAASISVTGAGGDFLGGAILPGAEVGAWALHEATAGRLPRVDVSDAAGLPEGIPNGTDDALRFGLLHGLAGALDRVMEELAARTPSPLEERILTGGGAPAIRPLLRTQVIHVEGLTMMGLCAYAKWRLEKG